MPCSCSGSPLPVTMNALGVEMEMSVNTCWRSRTACMRGHDIGPWASPRSGCAEVSWTS